MVEEKPLEVVGEVIIFAARIILNLILPPCGPLILALFGLLLLKSRHKKAGKMFLVSGILAIYFLSTGLAADLLIRPLENKYPPLKERVKADAIVILTAGARDLSHLGLEPYPDTFSLERLVHGYEIYRSLEIVPVIISGGKADPTKPNISTGKVLGRMAIAIGIPEKDLLIEDDSINTFEGALKVSEMLKGKGHRVILVTSAFHMARSAGLYKKAGLEVIPAPASYMSGPISLNLYSFIPTAGNMGTSSTALYEYLSTLWYIIKGTI